MIRIATLPHCDSALDFSNTDHTHEQIGRTLTEQLSDAVASEQYELAARLRDELNQRLSKKNRS